MDRFELQRLRDLPIEGVAERLGLQVTRHKCLCPFHEDHHPSMSFSIRRNTYRCFVCGEHGGTIDLVMKYQRLGFKEAVEWLGGAEAVSSFKFQVSSNNPVIGSAASLVEETSNLKPSKRNALKDTLKGLGFRLRRGGFSLRSASWILAWCAGVA